MEPHINIQTTQTKNISSEPRERVIMEKHNVSIDVEFRVRRYPKDGGKLKTITDITFEYEAETKKEARDHVLSYLVEAKQIIEKAIKELKDI